MRSLLIMAAAAAAAAIALSGCRDKKPEPVPGPQSVLMRSQGKVYFTYQGGPIFQTEAPAPTASAAPAAVADGPDRGGKANDAPAGTTQPAQPGTTHP
jgi:hypothetical protein